MFLSLLVFHEKAALKEYVAVTNLSPGRLFHLLVVPTGRSRALKLAPVIRSSISATISISESSLPVQRGKSNERSYWVTAID